MQEPQQIQLNVFDCQSEETRKQCESFAARLETVYRNRATTEADMKTTQQESEMVDFQLTTEAIKDIQKFYGQSFIDEKNILIEVAEKVPAMIDEARKLVRERESECETAFNTIKADLDPIGLPFTNENQESFFIRGSKRYREFENHAGEARNFETSANQVNSGTRRRIEWLNWKAIQLKNKLLGPSLV